MELKNYMEDIVVEKLDEILKNKEKDVCRCDRCRADMAALALNGLPSKYVVTSQGYVYTKLDQLGIQSKTDVIVLLEKAIKIVSNNPRHENRKN